MEKITIIDDFGDWHSADLFDVKEIEPEPEKKEKKFEPEPEKLNFLGLNEEEYLLVKVLLFGGIYVILFVTGMMTYTNWYFNN